MLIVFKKSLHFLGDHLCEVCSALHGIDPVTGGAELPCNMYPQGDASRGKVGVGGTVVCSI